MTFDNAPTPFGEMFRHMMWQPAQLVRGAIDALTGADAYRQSILNDLQNLNAELDEWIEESVEVRKGIWGAFQAGPQSEVGAAFIGEMIDAFEAAREHDAIQIARLEKAYRRDWKSAKSVSKKAAAVLEETDKLFLDYLKRVQAAKLEYSLFMRAHRAELDPSRSRGGPVFSDPKEMEGYLRGLIA